MYWSNPYSCFQYDRTFIRNEKRFASKKHCKKQHVRSPWPEKQLYPAVAHPTANSSKAPVNRSLPPPLFLSLPPPPPPLASLPACSALLSFQAETKESKTKQKKSPKASKVVALRTQSGFFFFLPILPRSESSAHSELRRSPPVSLPLRPPVLAVETGLRPSQVLLVPPCLAFALLSLAGCEEAMLRDQTFPHSKIVWA